MGETYTHPETGETIEIPDGARIDYADGEVVGWSNPPVTPEGELHPSQVEGYEPKFDRLGTQRRVLAFITDEDHMGRGPRNTVERLSLDVSEDPYTRYAGNFDQMQGYLQELEEAGLVAQTDGVYSVTDAGMTELVN